MKTLVRFVSYGFLLAGFFAAGLYAGPVIRTAYAYLFPAPEFVPGDYSELYAQASKSVVIFTTSTCPYCQHVRELLKKENVDFYDFMIDQSSDAEKRYAALNEESVPVVFIGNRKIVGAQDQIILRALQEVRLTKAGGSAL